MLHQGSCHCGKVAFEVEMELDQVMECNCSHCSRKGFLLAFTPAETFRLLTPRHGLATYHFNKHAIDHHFCETCGCAPFAEGKGREGEPTVAINARCVTTVEIGDLTRIPVDGRSR